MICLLTASALGAVALASGTAAVEVVAGGRTSPGMATVGPSELLEGEPPAGLGALRVEGETSAWRGAWLGGTSEYWGYVSSSDASLVRAEPRAGWHGAWDSRWFLDAGGRYAGEITPWEPEYGSGRAEASLTGGREVKSGALSGTVSAVQRDYFWQPAWSFREGEVGLAARLNQRQLRLVAQLSVQGNAGYTTNLSGGLNEATGAQGRLRADAEWTTPRVDVSLAWRLFYAVEGDVENAARPQFTPLGLYADDADALSAGGFLQNRFDLGSSVRLGEHTSLHLAGLLRLRTNTPGRVASTWTQTYHGELGGEHAMGHGLSWLLTAGVTTAGLESGGRFTDAYGWTGLRWTR